MIMGDFINKSIQCRVKDCKCWPVYKFSY